MAQLRQAKSKPFKLPFITILSHGLLAVICFHFGVLSGSTGATKDVECPAMAQCPECPKVPPPVICPEIPQDSKRSKGDLFPDTVGKFVSGAAVVDRADFLNTYDTGLPWDEPQPRNDQVLLLYSQRESAPQKHMNPDGKIPQYKSAKEATQNCEVMKTVHLTPAVSTLPNTCLAIVGQWESFMVHRWMRLPEHGELDPGADLKLVSRSHLVKGTYQDLPKAKVLAGRYGDMLRDYLERLPGTLDRLKPLADKAAGKHRTVIVMVCNFGQAELLMNFVCSSRARGMDIYQVLVFATDEDVAGVAKGLGLNVFEVGDDFGEMPKEAARMYGDLKFTGMMMAKVYCVHLVISLGYHVLFQDVDVVWYKHPLTTFFDHHQQDSDFDLYFQDDGARSARYIPYSPNTGFYFVRHNERTEYLFSSFVRMGDVIDESGSHQSALTSLMVDHSSWRGLKVKVFSRDDREYGHLFPGGFHYHMRRDFMHKLVNKELDPIVFHMSWTKNKDNKKKYFQQMDDWFVNDKCDGKKADDIGADSIIESCCLAQANFRCHYRDKPSRKPCKDSPPIDKGRKSFWK